MKQYQYKLAKRGKWVCPECGHKTFVCYVDDEGQILSEEVGKCDRADNCNYHYPPREYFRDNGLNLKPATLSRPSSRPKNNVRPKPTYIDPEMFKT